ncbi:hypothetical protein GCM10007052_02950 [Halioglobus japonicus]|nr:hypothetical protein GCM10007052_02950 [Halioglobus japonicus]
MSKMFSIKPKLRRQIIKDIRHDMSKDMKKEKTNGVYFFGINDIP